LDVKGRHLVRAQPNERAGQQGGQQGQQGQQGGQGQQAGQGGQQGGQRQGGQPGQAGGAWGGPGGADYWNGGWPVNPREFATTYRDTLNQLRNLQPQVRDDAEFNRDLQGLIRDLQRLDPSTISNDPLLAERINSALMGGIEQVELQLRRKVDEAQGGSVRSQGSGSVPAGWADAVAEYFRKLSKGK
jgi:hypothetical protein